MYSHNNRSSAASALLEPLPKSIASRHGGTPSIVVSSFDDDLLFLLDILKQMNWAVYWFGTCVHALHKLNTGPVPVVLCDIAILEGGWHDFLAVTKALAPAAALYPDGRTW